MTAMAGLYAGNVRAVLERGFKVIGNQNWTILVSGFFEPVFYLLAMGYGLGGLVGQVSGPNGTPMSYLSFIAPALLATSAMNGAIYDSTWNVFFKMKFARIYEAMLSTSLGPLDVAAGEIGMALFRGLLYACGFLVVMAGLGIATSWWALPFYRFAASHKRAGYSEPDRFLRFEIRFRSGRILQESGIRNEVF